MPALQTAAKKKVCQSEKESFQTCEEEEEKKKKISFNEQSPITRGKVQDEFPLSMIK